MKRSRFTDSQIMDALKRVEAGLSVTELCRELGISMPTFYKWRPKYGGMDTAMISRLKELEAENTRPKIRTIRGCHNTAGSQEIHNPKDRHGYTNDIPQSTKGNF
jgi:putative transposase